MINEPLAAKLALNLELYKGHDYIVMAIFDS